MRKSICRTGISRQADWHDGTSRSEKRKLVVKPRPAWRVREGIHPDFHQYGCGKSFGRRDSRAVWHTSMRRTPTMRRCRKRTTIAETSEIRVQIDLVSHTQQGQFRGHNGTNRPTPFVASRPRFQLRVWYQSFRGLHYFVDVRRLRRLSGHSVLADGIPRGLSPLRCRFSEVHRSQSTIVESI